MSKQKNFFTRLDISQQENKIQCDSTILTLGSCFSDNIGNLMSDHLFDASVNPFGTIFNPISISRVMRMALNGEEIVESDLSEEGGRFFHYDFILHLIVRHLMKY